MCDANELNNFYSRFERAATVDPPGKLAVTWEDKGLSLTVKEVERQLKAINANKAPGPDGIHPHSLRIGATSLAIPLHQLFMRSIKEQTVPSLWKQSDLKPIPKGPKPTKEVSDYRPIALTSVVVKTLEKLLLNHMRASVQGDRRQFAYCPNRSTQDALICLTDYIILHIDARAANYARCLFIDFSSAFNTLRPSILVETLQRLEVDGNIIGWLNSFLTNRKRRVVTRESRSAWSTTNVGTPQGSVISPFLFTLYADNLKSEEPSVQIFKYANDIALVGCCSGTAGEESYSKEVNRTSKGLLLNESKTKELIFTVARKPPATRSIIIDAKPIEQVQSFKHLGTILTGNFDFTLNVDARVSKAQQRLYTLKRLRYAEADVALYNVCYSAFIHSVLCCHLVPFYNHISAKSARAIRRITSTANSISGRQFKHPFSDIEQQQKNIALSIYCDQNHPFTDLTVKLPSGRIRSSKHRTFCGKKCFLAVFTNCVNLLYKR